MSTAITEALAIRHRVARSRIPLPPSYVSSSNQAFFTPQPPLVHTSGLWPHFTCPCVWICVTFLLGLCPLSSGQYFSFVHLLSTIDRICDCTQLLCLLMVDHHWEVVISSMIHVLWICCSLCCSVCLLNLLATIFGTLHHELLVQYKTSSPLALVLFIEMTSGISFD